MGAGRPLSMGLMSGLGHDAEALARQAANARARLGTVERDLVVGGVTIRLVCAGPTLADALWTAFVAAPTPVPGPAPASLPVSVGTPSVTIELWDVSEAGEALPPLSVLEPDPVHPGSTYRQDAFREAWFQPVESAISLIDHEQRRGWYCVRSTADLPAWEAGAPLRALLRWALAEHDLHLVHAAGIGGRGRDGRGLLLTGRGGSGKSTTTALCALAGLSIVGDDYVVLDPVGRQVHALYRTAKLDPHLVAAHAVFAAQPRVPVGTDKVMLLLDELGAGCFVRTLPIDAVVTPHVRGDGTAATRFTATSPAHALRALAPSTMLQLPGHSNRSLEAMSAIAAAAPTFEASLGADLDVVAPAVVSFLTALTPTATVAVGRQQHHG